MEEKEMKKTIKRVLALLCVLAILVLVSACGTKKKEEVKGVSYDKVVCQISATSSSSSQYESFNTNVTVYADNTVKMWTGPYDGDFVSFEEISSRSFTITKEQKNKLIELIRENKIINCEDLSNKKTNDGVSKYIYLFDELGYVMHECGGLSPTNKRFNTVFDMVWGFVPKDTAEILKGEATDKIVEAENRISYNRYICQIAVPDEINPQKNYATVFTIYGNGVYEMSEGYLDDPAYISGYTSKKYIMEEIQKATIINMLAEYIYPAPYETKQFDPNNIKGIDEAVMYVNMFDKKGEVIYTRAISHKQYNMYCTELVEYIRMIVPTGVLPEFEKEAFIYRLSHEKNISTDKVIVSCKDVWRAECACEYTLYADNTLKAAAIEWNEEEQKFEEIYSQTFEVDRKQVSKIESAIMEKIIIYNFANDYSSITVCPYVLNFFDKNGEEIYVYPITEGLYLGGHDKIIEPIKALVTEEDMNAIMEIAAKIRGNAEAE